MSDTAATERLRERRNVSKPWRTQQTWRPRVHVGHDDGGYLIATVYTELGRRRAIARAQRAMDAFNSAATPPPSLSVVEEAA